jgi:general secretion pathway protein K
MGKQRGIALLVVLLMLSLMVSMAATITLRYRLAWQRTYNQQVQLQNEAFLIGAEDYAITALRDQLNKTPNKMALDQHWAQPMHQDVAPIVFDGIVRDQQACFNLNALSSDEATDSDSGDTSTAAYIPKVFQHLLMGLGVEEDQALAITEATQDWLDSNSDPRNSGAEDSDYQAMNPPYLTGNTLMQDVSELRAVKGVSATLYRQLQPYICALPVTDMTININTLRPTQAKLLSALLYNTISDDDAKTILVSRPEAGWDSLSDFTDLPAISSSSEADAISSVIALRSYYFQAILQATQDQHTTRLISLIQRQSSNKLTVIRRHFGGVE